MRRFLACTALLLSAACGTEETSSAEVQSRGVSTAPAGAGPLDALSRRFGRVRAAMRKRGYVEVGSLPRQFALEGSGRALPLDLPTGRCSTIVALGSGGVRDLRLTLYDGQGAEVAVDAVEREGGLVHVCPQGDVPRLPYHVALEAREGSGAIASALFESDQGDGRGFEGVFENVLAPVVPFRELEERLAQSREALRERGLIPLQDARLEGVAEGEVLREPVQLEADRCYVAVARAGEGLADVDLFLYDPAGAEVARDLKSDAEPSLEHCPDQPGRHIFEARAFEGAGAVGLMIMSGPVPEPNPDAGAPVPEERRETESEAKDSVAALGGVTERLADRGYEPVFVLREGTIMPGEVRTHEVLLGPGCGLVVGVGGRPGMDLDLYLSDASGEPADRDARVEPTARVSACPAEASVMRVTVKAYGREAPYALTVMRAPEGISDVQSLRLEEADATYRARGYRRRRVRRVALATGERVRRTVEMGPGRCLAVAAAGDRGVEDLDLFLRSPTGQLLASESGPAPWAAVSRCAEATERLELELLLYRGEGEVAFVELEGRP